jgi:hypothetical protein
MTRKWAMAKGRRVVGDREVNGNGGKSDGNGNEGGGQATAARAVVMRVTGKQRQ